MLSNKLLNSVLLSIMLTATLSAAAGRPQIVAHRGYWKAEGSAQNSIRALVKADSVGADAVELDVWISADSVLYVNHDPDFGGIVIKNQIPKSSTSCALPTANNCRPSTAISRLPKV